MSSQMIGIRIEKKWNLYFSCPESKLPQKQKKRLSIPGSLVLLPNLLTIKYQLEVENRKIAYQPT